MTSSMALTKLAPITNRRDAASLLDIFLGNSVFYVSMSLSKKLVMFGVVTVKYISNTFATC